MTDLRHSAGAVKSKHRQVPLHLLGSATRVEELLAVVLADAEGVQAHLIGILDLRQSYQRLFALVARPNKTTAHHGDTEKQGGCTDSSAGICMRWKKTHPNRNNDGVSQATPTLAV